MNRNTAKIFVPPLARCNFFKYTPLTWNPGSAPGHHISYTGKNKDTIKTTQFKICEGGACCCRYIALFILNTSVRYFDFSPWSSKIDIIWPLSCIVMYYWFLPVYDIWWPGADPGFQVRGVYLKKLHRACSDNSMHRPHIF
jgi:hypothetical protein